MAAASADDIKELENLYSPSLWTKRFTTGEEVIKHHIVHTTTESDKAVNTIPHKLEIEYGSTPGQRIDIFGTDLPNDSPILVYIHGGYWQMLSREMSRYPVLPLHHSKIKVIVVGYDLCPTVTLPEIVDQILNAAKFVFEYAENMKSRGVYFAGHSAGAHLVAKLLSNAEFLDNTKGSRRLQAVFLISGVFDLQELVLTSNNDALQLPHEWVTTMSPLFDSFSHLQERRIRIYIVAGQYDSPAFIRQSKEFYELLQEYCLVKNLYLEIKDGMDHFDIVECLSKEDNYLRNLLVHDIGKNL